MHVQGGSIKEHLRTHQIHINRGLLDDNTESLRTERCPSMLKLYEALFISREKPRINMQISPMAPYPYLIFLKGTKPHISLPCERTSRQIGYKNYRLYVSKL